MAALRGFGNLAPMRVQGLLALTLLTWSVTGFAASPDKTHPRAAHHEEATKPTKRRAATEARSKAPPPRKRRSLTTELPEHATAPSYRYANMGAATCLAELDARRIAYTRVEEAPGVLAPVRIPAGVGGVRYHTAAPASQRATSPYEVFDCRLVLALDDLAALLRARGFDEVVTFSGWRPPRKGWPKDKLAVRHPGGLAVDIKTLMRSGSKDPDAVLEIENDYQGKIDAPSCGPDAFAPDSPSTKTVLLREIVCEAVEARLFTSVLTPNHDDAHRNHLHLDLAPNVTWRIVR